MELDEDLFYDNRRDDGRKKGRKKGREGDNKKTSRLDDEAFIREKMKDPRIVLYEEVLKEKLNTDDMPEYVKMVLGSFLIANKDGLLPYEAEEMQAKEEKLAEIIKAVREKYKPGTMVSFISSKNHKCCLHSGDIGTVTDVDDTGIVHLEWDSGVDDAIVMGRDMVKVIYTPSIEEEEEGKEKVPAGEGKEEIPIEEKEEEVPIEEIDIPETENHDINKEEIEEEKEDTSFICEINTGEKKEDCINESAPLTEEEINSLLSEDFSGL